MRVLISKTWPALVLFGLLAIISTPVAVWAFPHPPNIFWGPVLIDDNPAPDGLQIVAKLNVREGNSFRLQTFSTATTFQGNYGVKDRLAINGDDPDTPEKEGAAEGEPIFFFLVTPSGELPAVQEPPTFQVGRVSKLVLHFPGQRAEVLGQSVVPGGFRPAPGSTLAGRPAAAKISTVGVVVSNFTDSLQLHHLMLVQGNEVVQRHTVPVANHSEVRVEFEVSATDMMSYRVQSSGESGSLVPLGPGASRLTFNDLRVTPPEVANGKPASITVNVSNPSLQLVHRRVFLQVSRKFVDPPRDIVVESGEVQHLNFEYIPVGLKVGPVPVMVGNATGILTVVDPAPLGLYIPLMVCGSLAVLGAAAWLYRRARRVADDNLASAV